MWNQLFGSSAGRAANGGELQPLQPDSVSDNPSEVPTNMSGLQRRIDMMQCSKSNLAMGTLVAVVLVLYFGFPTSNTIGLVPLHGNKGIEPPVPTNAEEGPGTTVMYRPFCIHYGENNNKNNEATVKLLQTSMQSPSQQWSLLPCYHESERSGLWKKRKPQVDVWSDETDGGFFGAPDASFQVNFSHWAFPQRKTPILGFGGAFTEAASLNFHSLNREGQEAVLELLFGKTGLGYSKGRVHMNSCDFSIKSYSFDDVEDDFKLKHFDVGVTHDVESGMVDFALRATSKLREAWASEDGMDGVLRLYASPWSPPSWMKKPTWQDHDDDVHSESMLGSAQPTCIRDGTGEDSEYAKAWALYFSKFLTAYSDLGLPFFGVTPQNEPEFPAPWEACSHTPITESDFVGYHLGPQLAKDHPNVKIIGFDHNKDHIVTWVNELIGVTSPSTPYISGTAYHWYAGGNNRILDGALGAPNMHRLQAELDRLNADPEHFLLNIESCHCPYTGYGGGDLDVYWSRAERYTHTILSDLAAGSNGWMEWNFILDSQGGPNHLNNLCDSSLLAAPHRASNAPVDFPPLLAWEKTNATKQFGRNIGDGRTLPELNALGFPAKYLELGVVVQPMFYYMGHISRYVRPGSRAVSALVNEAETEDGSMTFRPAGQTVSGGGINDLAQPDVEVTFWPCEGSTRQYFHWDVLSRQLKVFGHDWLGTPRTSCVSNIVHKDLRGLVLVECDAKHFAGTFDIVKYENYTNFVVTNGRNTEKCLILEELSNDGGAYGPRGGAQAGLGSCDSPRAQFHYDEDSSEISSIFYADEDGHVNRVCMTTGWPFLQMGAFYTPNGEAEKTMVILNEAHDAANYAIRDAGKLIITGSIPPRSIQTLLINN